MRHQASHAPTLVKCVILVKIQRVRHCASADDMPDFPLEVFNIGFGFWPRAAIVLAIMVAAYFLGRGLRLR